LIPNDINMNLTEYELLRRDKIRTGSVSSGDFSEYDEGGGEFGGTGVKINEWQAAWNVTNAIQVL